MQVAGTYLHRDFFLMQVPYTLLEVLREESASSYTQSQTWHAFVKF